MEQRIHRLLHLLRASAIGVAIAFSSSAEPELELRVRLEPQESDGPVVIKAPKFGTAQLVASRDESDVFVAKLGLPAESACVLPFDVAANAGEREQLLHLQLVRPRLSNPVETLLYAGVAPESPTRRDLIRWQEELQQAAADARSPDEDGMLLAYFRGRNAFRHWHEKDPAHENTIRAAKLWFDAAYQLARLEDRPYRMDRAAIRAVQELESLVEAGGVRATLLRQQFQPGYASTITAEADALLFRYIGEVRRLSQARRYSEALALNTCLLEEFQRLPSKEKSRVAKTQSFSEELLSGNDSFLRQKVEPPRPAGDLSGPAGVAVLEDPPEDAGAER